MRLSNLKRKILIPEKEIFINKSVTINNQKCVLAGLVSQYNQNKLYILKCSSDAEIIEDKYDDELDNLEIIGGSYLPQANFDSGLDDRTEEKIKEKYNLICEEDDLISDIEETTETDKTNESGETDCNKEIDCSFETDELFEESEYDMYDKTYRDNMINNLLDDTDNFFINKLSIQNQAMTFKSAQESPLISDENKDYILQHYIEKGLDISLIEQYDISDICICVYEQSEDEEFPIIDNTKPLDITIEINDSYKQYLINQELELDLKKYDAGNKYEINLEPIDRTITYYINKVEHYDLWKESEKYFNSPAMQKVIKDNNISDEEIIEMKKTSNQVNELYCSKEQDIVIIEYEVEDDISLNFYSKDYLDRTVDYNKSGVCGVLCLSTDKKNGQNGLKNHACPLSAVEKDYYGKIDIELFSCTIKMPGKTIKI